MTPTENSILIGVVIATFGVALTAVVTYLKNLNTEITSIKIAMSRLDTQVSPLWAKVQAQISADLHHPHPQYKEMDGLLEKLEAKPVAITDYERERLEVLLKQRSKDMGPDITDSQRASAVIMIPVMKKVLEEAAQEAKDPTAGRIEGVKMPSYDKPKEEPPPPNMPEKSASED